MSTRPRVSFDQDGRCNACVWSEKKKKIDWDERERILLELLSRYRKADGNFDCLVPVSGGKDGSYIAYQLKYKYGMNPLALTVTPPLPLELGEKNLKNFINSGYNHISINPDASAMQTLNRIGFIEHGFPYFGWLMSIVTAVFRMAASLNIGLIFYGEDGETEYGGSSLIQESYLRNVDFFKTIGFEGGYEKIIEKSGLDKKDLFFFTFPDDEVIKDAGVEATYWSFFEPWDPYRNYLVAKEHCGLVEAEDTNVGTFTNFAQNDQALYALHTYIMYLKFGFGRANQDASIEIRRGAMDREQAVNLVRLYDGQYPEEYIDKYLDYYKMSQGEFDSVIDRWANKELFEKVDGRWKPRFTVE